MRPGSGGFSASSTSRPASAGREDRLDESARDRRLVRRVVVDRALREAHRLLAAPQVRDALVTPGQMGLELGALRRFEGLVERHRSAPSRPNYGLLAVGWSAAMPISCAAPAALYWLLRG